ncbi:corrinoid ABC transporter substrate-binding protein [Blastochloris viridis]|uniref:Corrinoid ABC transporter substrate-binding protein n=1 Tax=Blastochloris viridis TaxID=1079 RepID=A0A0S4PZM9_BLAVI|nr:corrinoid ABC transporter substrate-binding protein [Blastochloris viridis]
MAEAHPRVVSINMCTDQLVLALADPDQILALSVYARDPMLSFGAAAAANYPSLSGVAEEVLVLQPDLVLSGRYTRQTTRGFLKAKGVALAEFDIARSIADATAQIRRAGELLGQPARADAAVAAIDAAVARAKARQHARLSVLPLQRRGWVAGGAPSPPTCSMCSGSPMPAPRSPLPAASCRWRRSSPIVRTRCC